MLYLKNYRRWISVGSGHGILTTVRKRLGALVGPYWVVRGEC